MILVAGPTGIEPAAYGLRVRRSGLTELRAHLSAFEKEFQSTNIELSLYREFMLFDGRSFKH